MMVLQRCGNREKYEALSELLYSVIPAKAGIHLDLREVFATRERPKAKWIPAFAGMTVSG